MVGIVQRLDAVTLAEGHCETSPDRNRISLAAGQKCAQGCCESNISKNVSVQNMKVLSEGFASNIVWGSVVKNVPVGNVNGRCTLETGTGVYSACPPNPLGEGKANAEIVNILDDAFRELGVCFNVVLFAGNCGVDTTFLPFLNDSVSCCHKEDQGGVRSSHFINATVSCAAWTDEEQMINHTGAVEGITNHQEKCYQEFENSMGCKITRPPMNALECGLADPTQTYISRSLEDVKASIKNYSYDSEKLVEFCICHRQSHTDPILTDDSLPEWLKIYVQKNSDKLPDNATIENVLSLLGSNSVKARCKKNNCTTIELMKNALETGAANSDRTVKDINQLGGSRGGSANTNKQNTARAINLEGAGSRGGSANTDKQNTARAINLEKAREILGSRNKTRKSLVKDIDFSKKGVGQTAGKLYNPFKTNFYTFHSKVLLVLSAEMNWQVRFSYHGTQRSYGTFATKEKAALANEAARKYLNRTRNDKLTVREIKTNVTRAIAVAQKAAEDEESDSV